MRETPDQKITRTAGPTAGVCRRADLLAAGVPSTSIERRLASGHLRLVARGLYFAPHLRTTLTPKWTGLLGVPQSVLSRHTAARVLGMPVPDNPVVHITAPKGTSRQLHGVVVHETRYLRGEDIQSLDGLAVTSPERTIVDLAAHFSERRVRHLVDEQYAGQSPGPFMACVAALARRGLKGSRVLHAVCDQLTSPEPLPASELERRIWQGLAEHDINGFRTQVRPPWYDGIRGVVDFARPDVATLIEGDGRHWHASQQAMADDRRRDRLAAGHGWLVLRLTWQEVVHRPAATFVDLAEIISNRQNAARAVAA